MARKRKKQFRAPIVEAEAGAISPDYEQMPERSVPREESTDKMLLEYSTVRHGWLHRLIFAALSALFFVFAPLEFLPSLLSGIICVAVFLHVKKIKFVFRKWYELLLFALVAIYLACGIFGFDIYMVNSMNMGPFQAILYSILCFIWTAYVLQSALDAFKALGKIKLHSGTVSNKDYWKKWLLLFVIMFSVFMVWQRAFNPVIMSPDSWDFIQGWLSGTYFTFRSPVYSFLISIVLRLAPTKPEVQWVAIAQIITFSSLLCTLLMYFHLKRVNYKYLLPFAVILPLIPSFALHTLVIWMDLATGMTVLWLSYVLIRILDEVIVHDTASPRQQYSFYLQLCLSLVLVYFIRTNSFLVYIVMAPVLALLFLLKKQWKLLVTIAVSLALVLLIRYPGYNALFNRQRIPTDTSIPTESLTRTNFGDTRYRGGIHDIVAVYYNDGNLSDRTLNTLRSRVPRLDEPEIQSRFIFGYGFQGTSFDFRGFTTGEFLRIYIDTFFRNPFLLTRAVSARVLSYWIIAPHTRVSWVNYTAIYDRPSLSYITSAPSLGVSRQHNRLTEIMNNFMRIMVLPVPETFFWRYGLWTSMMLISLIFLILRRKFLWLLVFLPVFSYLATLYMTNLWLDFRYGLPVLFTGMFLPPISILLGRKNNEIV